MICPNCNATDHEPGAKFCHKCGMPLINKEEPPKPKEDDDDNDFVKGVLGVIHLIGAVLIFFFYAKTKFGLFWGFFYSLYWIVTVPIHLLYWIFICYT